MSAVGLTKAQESGLQYIRGDHNRMPTERVFRTLYEAGLCAPGGGQLTPRGHAALAAPRMTDAQLSALEWYANGQTGPLRPHGKTINRLYSNKWYRDGDLTAAGRKALNDIRAAMGSELYKETME